MFKAFWEEKKHIIEAVGLFTAVGAIFLTIPTPDDTKAKIALFNIQIIWLLIISVLVVVLFISFLKLVIPLEKESKKRFSLDIEGALTGIIFATIFWFLLYWWQYIYILYAKSLHDFLEFLRYPMSIIFLAPIGFLRRKINSYYRDDKLDPYFLIGSALITATLYGLLNATWQEVINFSFNFSNWLRTFKAWSSPVYILEFYFILIVIRRENIFKKINKIFDKKVIWAFFGGIAIAIHNGKYYRGHRNINIILSDQDNYVSSLFKKMKVKTEGDTTFGYLKINGMPVELIFLKNINQITLADFSCETGKIENGKFHGIMLPVVSMATLRMFKENQKKSIENILDKTGEAANIKQIQSLHEDVIEDLKMIDNLEKQPRKT